MSSLPSEPAKVGQLITPNWIREAQSARGHWYRPGLLSHRIVLILILHSILLCLTYYLSFVLRLDTGFDSLSRSLFWKSLPLVLGIKIICFHHFGLLRGWWRYVGMSDLLDITKATLVSCFVMASLLFGFRPLGYPRSVILIDCLLTIFVIGGARFTVRAYTERVQLTGTLENILIVGAGKSGISLVRELKQNPNLNYNPVGFVDDDPTKHGIKISGVKVLGSTKKLDELIVAYQVKCILIAIPSAGGTEVAQIVQRIKNCKVEFRILPSMSDLIGQATNVKQVRKLRVEDLLNRHAITLDSRKIRAKIENKTILVTGAGGSIGSELARQVAALRPRQLILLDRSENDVFKLGNELQRLFPQLSFVPVIGDILDVSLLRDVFATYRPQSVFHAAAYKHVPLMEMNCFQAVTNNIFGTYNVAMLAKRYNLEEFVLISSDKAVNPTNIMGVTKRVAELIVLSLQNDRTRFVSVRFGNVLGSNGSVVPLFEDQIAHGGPITVTHPDARRYFMTIAEAVQLVLQASTMGQGGEIFVLDMGEPVRILDLVKNLIRLSGHEPDRDIEIKFTGLRPGEKMFEELQLRGEGIRPTECEKIMVLNSAQPNFEEVSEWLRELTFLVDAKNVHGLITKLASIVPEYRPSNEILSLSSVDRLDRALAYRHQQAGLSLPQNLIEDLDMAG